MMPGSDIAVKAQKNKVINPNIIFIITITEYFHSITYYINI